MKKLFFVWALLMASLFCYATTNGSVSDKEKERIKAEVKEVANASISGCEQVNTEMACGIFYDSPDFRYINNGKILGYNDLVNGLKPYFDTLTGQKFTFLDEHYNILDRSTVIYTLNCKIVVNFKDGHILVYDPAVLQFTFKKIGKDWKAIVLAESATKNKLEKQQAVKLNQIELFKQLATGVWKCKTGKDTIFTWDCRAEGNILEANSWSESNGKRFWENKSISVYDENSDKCIWTRIYKNGATQVYTWWFTSPSVIEAVPISNITNPADAIFKIKFEYLSPDSMNQTITINDKVADLFKVTRIKEVKTDTQQEGKLDQLELISQFKGSWTGEVSKDTFELWDGKLTGNGLDVNSRKACKNRILTQEHNVFVYDQSINKFIVTHMPKEGSPIFYTMRFTSKHAGEIVPINDISNPDNAQFKILFEFSPSGGYKETIMEKNKPALVNTYDLVKKK